MTDLDKELIIQCIKKEVVPAIGCTEPIAVALAVAKATETLGIVPEEIQVRLSANVLKNAMGVGIPGTGMIGLPIAIAMGALVGKSEFELQVLKDVSPEAIEKGKQMIEEKRIHVSLAKDIEEKLFIEVLVKNGDNSAKTIIQGEHTNFVFVEKNNEVLFEKKIDSDSAEEKSALQLNLKKVYDFAVESDLDDIRFILESARLNKNAAEAALINDYGHALGKTLTCPCEARIMGDSMLSKILSYTSAACDARMAGSLIPVMTNSGSGNQGISATLPVTIYAEEIGASEEALIRALILSHLTVIYIKNSMGRLSAFCGCVVASTGSACGITYLMGGGYQEVSYAVKNMVANLTGIICDGAKPGCSLKVSGSVATAVFSAMMAMEGKYVTALEGIIDEDVDKCIKNLTHIASQGMSETDKLILEIMTSKA